MPQCNIYAIGHAQHQLLERSRAPLKTQSASNQLGAESGCNIRSEDAAQPAWSDPRDRARVSVAWMVPGAGIEPARGARPQRILSPMRLPVSPPRQKASRWPAPGRNDLPSCRNQTTGVLTGGGDRIRTGAQGFAVLCLTTWLRRLLTTTGACADRPCLSRSGAGNGARTRDIHLGKVALYH